MKHKKTWVKKIIPPWRSIHLKATPIAKNRRKLVKKFRLTRGFHWKSKSLIYKSVFFWLQYFWTFWTFLIQWPNSVSWLCWCLPGTEILASIPDSSKHSTHDTAVYLTLVMTHTTGKYVYKHVHGILHWKNSYITIII